MGISNVKGLVVSSSLFNFFVTMMFFALVACLAVASAYDQAWEDYKLDFDKHYTAEEEAMRYANWKKDTEEVAFHNAMYGSEFTQAVNDFSDLTDEEYKEYYLSGYIAEEGESESTLYVPSSEPIPNEIDWRNQGMVTEVKNQGRCGSCYSFSATGALEGQWKKARGQLVSMSEKQIVDCSGRYGNMGCQGGRFQSSWRYIASAGGVESEQAYPYQPRQGYCRFNRGQVVASCSGSQSTASGSESDLANAIGRVGPVSVAIDASPSSFRRYRSGVHYAPSCSSSRMNHAVLAVGYGSEGGSDYFLVKNSWGYSWGDGGYIKMARNRGNNCGIASDAAFPLL